MTDIQARIDRELGRYALGFTPDFEEAGRLVSIIKELQAQLSEEQTTWKTTANVFCDRLGINQKTDAEYIVAAINNLLTQLSAKEALIAELQKENEWQDITSAPKDGTVILGAVFEDGDIMYVRKSKWRPNEKRWGFFTPDGKAKITEYSLHHDFTHWKPLTLPKGI